MEPTVTKRLHISGLTPSVSQQDLIQRLSTFGNVKSLDGLGILNAVGQPRKFAYATLEATPAKLSKCLFLAPNLPFAETYYLPGLNALSGSTWKGAKLRIGEAKPDFRERIKTENEKNAGLEPPCKKVRWKYIPYSAKHAQDMSLITLEKAKLKGGWVVTTLGRMHRPLKMRPSRPLPPIASTSSSNSRKDWRGNGKASVKMQKRAKKSDMRARRQKIDMVRYGSEYLKGRFLEVDHPFSVGRKADGDDCAGKESLGSDVDDVLLKQARTLPQISHSNNVDFEIFPPDGGRRKWHLQQGDHETTEEDVDVEMEDISLELPVEQRVSRVPEAPNKLRDLFAPTENEGTFSLLGHLNLDDDLELDEDIPFSIAQEANDLLQKAQVSEQIISVPRTTPVAKTNSPRPRQTYQINLNPSQPLFFPLALLATHPLAENSSFVHKPSAKNRPKDLFETAQAKNWDWPSSGFYRTQTRDEIRQRWEEQKGELTQGWRKRCREAGKIKRRRGKVGGGDDE